MHRASAQRIPPPRASAPGSCRQVARRAAVACCAASAGIVSGGAASARVVLASVASAWVVSGCAAWAPASEPAPVVRGPLGVTTNAPVIATMLQFPPRRATVLEAGDVRLDATLAYSSMFENGRDPVSRVVFDGEIARAAAGACIGVGGDTDLEVSVPLVFATAGFLDEFIEAWHDALGLPNGGRGKRPRNDYAMHLDQGGRRAYELENDALLLGDVPVFVTTQVADEARDGVGVALRAAVELPTGSASKGVGNGGFDWGGGLVLERSLGRFTFTAGAYRAAVSTPRSLREVDVELQDLTTLHGTVETRWNDAASIVTGLRWSSAVTRDVFIEELDGSVLELDVGLAIGDPARRRFVLGLSEDLFSESGPDWTAFFGWSEGF